MNGWAAIAGATIVERKALHRERFAYCAHPHLAVTASGAWLLVFNGRRGARQFCTRRRTRNFATC